MLKPVRTRIAPSPTGDWHLGNARTALFSFLFARRHEGKFFLRIEDTDQTRFVPGSIERLQETLDWLGLRADPLDDGAPYFRQSENLPRYREVAEQLVVEGNAYYCFATPDELEALRQEQQAKKLPPRYDGRYRDYSLEKAKERLAAGEPHVIRQKMPQTGTITFTDLVHGAVTVEAALLDDHVLLKSDGYPTYHLAHVVDDHDMAISHVVRGDEWLASAPRHLVLHQMLGWEVPQYAHVPVILGPDKGKLSKRHGAKPILEYRDDGYLPEAVINFLVLLGWSSGTEEEVFSCEELIAQFDFARVHASPAVFDRDRLDWFNARYIRNLAVEELEQRLLDYWQERDPQWLTRQTENPTKFRAIVAELQTRLTTLKELADLAEFFYTAPHALDPHLIPFKQQTPADARAKLTLAAEALEQVDDWTQEQLEATLRQLAEAQGCKTGEILWPIRVALTGQPASPGAFEVLAILGKAESLKRIAHARTVFEA